MMLPAMNSGSKGLLPIVVNIKNVQHLDFDYWVNVS